ncbi:NAD(P)/FAD-dependent oxidoreductase [Kitasatospora sp. NBC_01287]|uniref:NAD(P)/FAD-dependent oxidoreductase n=1 Tax=Kitasatospora sp. NBC_01287 TaxID=2903573 RepID=UPI002254B1F9|nr:NAD(P)/FAD-dependent oxidoreductase [Kitasatospora sp. NBC_01287]MCX4751531.1 NAD(P)/FAD-dependent oxidoreductase [Kitasatospora sp. NBC_01287]
MAAEHTPAAPTAQGSTAQGSTAQGRPAGSRTADEPVARRRVVILGGGFAGLFAVRALRSAPVAVTLVDRCAHHLFQPLLYQCASGILSEGQIAQPLRAVLRHHPRVRCLQATATEVDVAERLVRVRRPDGGVLELPYDDLIVGIGVRQSYFGHDEFAAHAPGMKTLADALAVRAKLYQAFELAEASEDPRERERWLTFALVGGGPTGVELAGQIREIAGRTLDREFSSIDPGQARVLLFDGSDAVLGAFGPVLSRRAARTLAELGVEVHLRSIVTAVDEQGLTVRREDGGTERVEARTVLWTAGVEAPPLATALARATGAEQDRAGRIRVEPDLTIAGHREIRVVGDLMSLAGLPGLAEVAMQSGAYAGRRIRHAVEGRAGKPRPFRYLDLGSAAYISRGRAVVKMGRFHASGLLGWLIWLFVHIVFLTGFRSRAGALLSWAVSFASGSRRERAFVPAPPHPPAAQAPSPPAHPSAHPSAPPAGPAVERPEPPRPA